MRIPSCFYLFFFCSQALAYNPYSNPELDTIEKQFVQEINSSAQVIRTPLAAQYINQLGARLTRSINMQPSTFFIVNSPEINAFAGPGGYIGIHSGLILATSNEDELAAVMAHELAHVKLHHLYDMIEHEKLMRIPTAASILAAIALGAINPALGSGAMAAAMSGAAQQSINYTREHEHEADRIGIKMLMKAGFNPQAMAGFFRKMQQETRYSSFSSVPAILRTHPLDQERIAEAEERIPKNYHAAYSDSLDYELFKTLVRNATVSQPKKLIDFYTNQPMPDAIPNQYGLALALLDANRYQAALARLYPLLERAPNQPFFIIAIAKAHMGLNQADEAISALQKLHETDLKSKAYAIPLAQTYLDAGRTQNAVKLLTKTFRAHPKDLMVCKMLSEAEAKNKRPAYAYFIEAQCNHLQGQAKLAIQRLKLAKKLARDNAYLQARIDAKIDEISFMENIKVNRS